MMYICVCVNIVILPAVTWEELFYICIQNVYTKHIYLSECVCCLYLRHCNFTVTLLFCLYRVHVCFSIQLGIYRVYQKYISNFLKVTKYRNCQWRFILETCLRKNVAGPKQQKVYSSNLALMSTGEWAWLFSGIYSVVRKSSQHFSKINVIDLH